MFGDDASHFHGIGQLQLAVGKLPVAVQVGRLDGSHFGLLFDVDDRQYRGGSLPINYFSREYGKSHELGRIDVTDRYMDGQFAFGLSTFLLSVTEARAVERGTAWHRFRRFLYRRMARGVARIQINLFSDQLFVPLLDSGDYCRLRLRFNLRPSSSTFSPSQAQNAQLAVDHRFDICPLLDPTQSLHSTGRFLTLPVRLPTSQIDRLRHLPPCGNELGLYQPRFVRLVQPQIA